MDKEKQNIDLIEGYLNETLNEEEVKLFHEKRILDDDFASLYYDMELMVEGIKRSASKTTIEEKLKRLQDAIDSQPQEEDDQIDSKSTPIRQIGLFNNAQKYSFAVAASLALLVLATVALLNINRLPTNEKLFAQNFAPFDNSGTTTRNGESANGDELLKRALLYYNIEEYELALERFQEINAENPNQPLYLMYEGNALTAPAVHFDQSAKSQRLPWIERRVTVQHEVEAMEVRVGSIDAEKQRRS